MVNANIMSENEHTTKTLRVDLKGVSLKRFRVLKEYYGVENDTELVRILISQEYQKRFGEP